MNRLQGKVALVTGAARGIGEAIARAFVAEGAHVLLSDINDRQGRALSDRLGERATYFRLDVREEPEWRAALERVGTLHGRLDILVNNAGITGFEHDAGPQDPENAVLSDWHRVHRTNLVGHAAN